MEHLACGLLFQLINFLYPGNVNYTILLQSKYWLSANIHVSFDTLLYLAEVFKNSMFKVLLYSFFHVLAQTLPDLVNKQECTMFILLITGYFKFYTKQDKTAQVLKFSNSKVHHYKFIRGRYAKSVLSIVYEALLSQKFYLLFFFLVCIF